MTLQVGSGGSRNQWLAEPAEAALMTHFVEGLVESAFGVAGPALHAPGRGAAKVAFARQVAIYLSHVRPGLNYSTAGRLFGRDRTTAAYACRVIEERREDSSLDSLIDCLERAIDIRRETDGVRGER